jgi:signal transduction histidine kinase
MIGNALKLASSRVEVSVARAERVIIRVQDDGPGFGEEALSVLGHRFVGHAAERGLGLSISMAMEILRAHGGSLTIEASQLPPGRRGSIGAAVVMTLPWPASSSAAPESGVVTAEVSAIPTRRRKNPA